MSKSKRMLRMIELINAAMLEACIEERNYAIIIMAEDEAKVAVDLSHGIRVRTAAMDAMNELPLRAELDDDLAIIVKLTEA